MAAAQQVGHVSGSVVQVSENVVHVSGSFAHVSGNDVHASWECCSRGREAQQQQLSTLFKYGDVIMAQEKRMAEES